MPIQRDMSPSVSIVVLTWNGRDLTLDCLSSLSSLEYPNRQVIVVDNGSSDSTVKAIRDQFPDVSVIRNNSNLGFAEGNNIGIRYALKHSADYVLILNNDTLVAPNMLAKLVDLAESKPEIGMVGPQVHCLDQADTLFAAGSFISWAKGTIWHRGMFEPARLLTDVGDPEPVDFITGCGLLVRRQLIETAGILDPAFYLNFEDVEWSVRARHHGFEIWYEPQSIMWHKISASLGRGSAQNTYYMTRNALMFFSRNAPARLRWLAVSRIIARTILTVAAWSLRSRYRTATFRSKRNANLLALRDFFLGRYGEMGEDVARLTMGI